MRDVYRAPPSPDGLVEPTLPGPTPLPRPGTARSPRGTNEIDTLFQKYADREVPSWKIFRPYVINQMAGIKRQLGEGDLTTKERQYINTPPREGASVSDNLFDLKSITTSDAFSDTVKAQLMGRLRVLVYGTEQEKNKLKDMGYVLLDKAPTTPRSQATDLAQTLEEQARRVSVLSKEKDDCEREKNTLSENLAESNRKHVQSLNNHLQNLTDILAGLSPLAQATAEVT